MSQLLAGHVSFFARRITRLTLISSCVALAVTFPASPASAAPVTCGSEITMSIRLHADLRCESGVALYLSGQNVVLNLGGHTISGSGGAGIRSTFGQSSTIRNGTIRGFTLGVDLDRTVGIRIQNIDFIGDSIGVNLTRAVTTTIVGNDIVDSGSAGISVYLSAQSRIARNTLRANGVGITLAFASNNTVSGNRVTRSGGDGIALSASASDNVVTGNTASRNGDDGIEIDGPANTVSENTANRNGDLGIEAVPGVTDGGGNTARRNGNPQQCTGVVCVE